MSRNRKPKKVAKRALPARPKNKREGPITLHPLDFDTALRGIVGIAVARRTKDAPEG